VGKLLLFTFQLIVVRSMYHILGAEHVCTLNTYPIRVYCATIYQNMEFVFFVIGTLN